MKAAPAIFAGRQEGIGHFPDFDLFTLTEPVGHHPIGSTVSEQTLNQHDYHVDAVVRRHPLGGYTHATALTGSARCYSDWWSSQEAAERALAGS
jgi:hypothetical protein